MICLVANACVLLSSAGRMNMNTKSSTIIFFGSTSHAVCVMCDSGEEETIDHLFFDCAFAKECWATKHIDWDVSLPLLDRFTQARSAHTIPFFTEAALIAAWELWKVRNDKIFQRRAPSPSIWLSNFKQQCNLQSVRFKDNLRSSFCVWLDAFS